MRKGFTGGKLVERLARLLFNCKSAKSMVQMFFCNLSLPSSPSPSENDLTCSLEIRNNSLFSCEDQGVILLIKCFAVCFARQFIIFIVSNNTHHLAACDGGV